VAGLRATRARIAPAARAAIVAAALAELPDEACGTLLGRVAGDTLEIRIARAGRNLAASSASFELDPAEIVAADAAAREHGLELVGTWHSHPAGPATPSRRDAEHAWSGWIAVIVSLERRAAPELRAWAFDGDTGPSELPLA
jgi:proteasome lid subunit RPN8/RPN11